MLELPTLADVVARCKGSVTVEVNPQRDVYETRERYLAAADHDMGPEEVAQVMRGADLYALRFYPATPVGFYDVYGVTLEDVVLKALAILDAD